MIIESFALAKDLYNNKIWLLLTKSYENRNSEDVSTEFSSRETKKGRKRRLFVMK